LPEQSFEDKISSFSMANIKKMPKRETSPKPSMVDRVFEMIDKPVILETQEEYSDDDMPFINKSSIKTV
jgi:hypothetical protein